MRHSLIRAVLLLALAAAVPACGGGGGGGGGAPGPGAVPVLLVSSTSGGIPGNADSSSPSISSDGNLVVFSSTATNLVVPNTSVGRSHVYLKNMTTGAITLISRPTGTTPGTQGDGNSFSPVISADGRFIAFVSSSRNLVTSVATITNAAGGPFNNVYLHDTEGPTTSLISNSISSPTQEANGNSGSPALTVLFPGPDVRVAFDSSATDLVTGLTDANAALLDVFLKPQGQPIECVSLSTTAATTGNGGSSQPSISADGNLIAYQSLATDLYTVDGSNPADTNGISDIIVRNMTTDVNKRVSLTDADMEITNPATAGNTAPMISADGADVVFVSTGTNLDDPFAVPNDIFIRVNWAAADPQTQHVSLHPSVGSGEGCGSPIVSVDGDLVLWHSPSAVLVNGDTNGSRDVFRGVRTSATAFTVDRVSLSNTGEQLIGGALGTITRPAMSAGGTFVAFDSVMTNVISPATSVRHVYRRG
jgi:hypothetical protein